MNLARKLENELSAGFVGREEEARVAVLALLTKQHAVFIGEPGTAKSALIHRLSQLVDARFYYYLLSKYTIPDELVGSIDPLEYRNGRFVRNYQGKLPDVELAFIDEVFKGSSETLNTLLNIMNERKFVDADGTVINCPLWSMYGASNELPSDSELQAFYDRFLLKHFVQRINPSAVEKAILHLLQNLNGKGTSPIVTLKEVEMFYDEVTGFMVKNASPLAKVTSQLVTVLRQRGIFVSDRTAVSPNHLPRLIATYSLAYDVDLKKASIAVSKYVLQNEEDIDRYKEALDDLYPAELRAAQEKLDMAKSSAVNGDLKSAKRLASEAIQVAQGILSNPDKSSLYLEEIKEVLERADKLYREIERHAEQLKKIAQR